MAGFGDLYDNPEDAAAAAQEMLQHQPGYKDNEYATVIFRNAAGKFQRSTFNTNNSPGKVSMNDLFNSLGPDEKPVAVLHNHPGGLHAVFDPTYLSDNDTQLGDKGAGGSGPLKMFLLAKDKLREGTGVKETARSRDGTLYNLQRTTPTLGGIPIHEMLQYAARSNPLTAAYLAHGGGVPLDPNAKMMQMPSSPFNAALMAKEP